MRYFLFVNGINQKRNAFTNWHLAAEEWVESSRTPPGWRADTFSYFAGVLALLRWFQYKRLVTACCEKLTRRQADLAGDAVIATGHSFGCAILCGTLQENPSLRIEELHLIAGAVSADCEANGLNRAIERGQVRRVVCHCSTADEWLGRNDLGKAGPRNAASDRIEARWYDGFRHSDYFRAENFDFLMRRVTGV